MFDDSKIDKTFYFANYFQKIYQFLCEWTKTLVNEHFDKLLITMLITWKNFTCNFQKTWNIFASTKTQNDTTKQNTRTNNNTSKKFAYEVLWKWKRSKLPRLPTKKSSSPDYLRAKRKALKIAKQYQDFPIYTELIENH